MPRYSRRTRGFDVVLAIAAAVLLFDHVMWYLLAARAGCRGFPEIGPVFVEIAVAEAYGAFGVPLVIFTGLLLGAARKSVLGARFCGSLAFILGVVMLLRPPAEIEGKIDDLQCRIVDGSLPWSIGLGSLWLGLGLMLVLRRRFDPLGDRTFPAWMTRTAAIAALLRLSTCTLPQVDSQSFSYSVHVPPMLGAWEGHAIEALNRWTESLHMTGVGPSLAAAALALTLVGIRQGSIGLTGLRTAILAFGTAQFVVILVNAVRLVSENGLIVFYAERSKHLGLPIAVIWAALWLAFGVAFCLIRREWWERLPRSLSEAEQTPLTRGGGCPPGGA